MDNSGNGERKITTTSPAPLILGLSIFGHDSSGTLLNGNSGDVLYALTEERFSNLKHDGEFPTRTEHIKARQVRYQEKYFSPERFLYPTSARIESQLSILKGQVDMYRNVAEERLSLIERLDLELKKLAPISNTKDRTNQ